MNDREESSREIQSLEARESRDKGLYVVVKLSGADYIGDGWTSFTFLHIDMNCRITVLSKVDSGLYCNGGCEGHEMKYISLTTILLRSRPKNLPSQKKATPKL
jgi:hypothetical protein